MQEAFYATPSVMEPQAGYSIGHAWHGMLQSTLHALHSTLSYSACMGCYVAVYIVCMAWHATVYRMHVWHARCYQSCQSYAVQRSLSLLLVNAIVYPLKPTLRLHMTHAGRPCVCGVCHKVAHNTWVRLYCSLHVMPCDVT